MTEEQWDSTNRQQLAEAFDTELDPLAAYTDTFETVDVDVFEVFADEVLTTRDIADRTRDGFERVFRQWRNHMAREKRHPACPHTEHVKRFVEYERDTQNNSPQTIKEKLRMLSQIYRYWQEDPSFPHPQDYNPFTVARKTINLSEPNPKEFPRIPLSKLRTIVKQITNIRDRTIVCVQLKLGLRATELCNLKLAELGIRNTELHQHYATLGDDQFLEGRPNAVYIPADRDGNKSRRPRVLPLDEELQHLLTRYLLIRPDTGSPYVFLSKNAHTQLRRRNINQVWKTPFHPQYAETDTHHAVTSHYGRHRFTTYWRVQQDLAEELVKYLRGDTPGPATIPEHGAINHYIHTYYEDIEDIYRDSMYDLHVS